MTMKRYLSGVLAATASLALAGAACAQGNNRGTSKVTLGNKSVSVDYGRPSLNGRKFEDLLSQLPADKVWRLGMNQSTTFTTSGELSFGDVKIPAGTYSLFAKQEGDNSWKLIFNKQHGQWGVKEGGEANRDPKLDVAAVPLTEAKAADAAEQVTINLAKAGDGGSITVLWGDMKLSTNFQ
jgi:DUF2911 family protein